MCTDGKYCIMYIANYLYNKLYDTCLTYSSFHRIIEVVITLGTPFVFFIVITYPEISISQHYIGIQSVQTINNLQYIYCDI